MNADQSTARATQIKWAAAAVGGLFLLFIVWPFNSVPTGSRGVVTQFGKIVGIEPEGLAVLPPWRKLSNFSIRAETASIDDAEGATSDTQPVRVALTVRYSIFPDRVAEVFEKYSHTGDLASFVQTATQEIFKSVTARYSAPDLIAQRARVSSDINQALREKLAIYGAQVINIDMRSFAFSPSYMEAINEKVTQEQKRLVAENTLLTVEAEQKQKVAIAEAEARRKLAGAQFLALQSQVVGEIDRAVAGFRVAQEQLQAGNELLATEQQQRKSTEAQLKAGGGDPLDVLAAQLELSNASLAQLDNEARLQNAFGALENALQRPADSISEVIRNISAKQTNHSYQ